MTNENDFSSDDGAVLPGFFIGESIQMFKKSPQSVKYPYVSEIIRNNPIRYHVLIRPTKIVGASYSYRPN